MSNFFNNRTQNALQGGMHAFGAEPTSIVNGQLEMAWLGKRYLFEPGNPMPKIMDGSPMTNWQKAMLGASGLMTGVSAVAGFMDGGFIGAARNVIWDIGVDAALVKHAYTKVTQGGVTTFSPGRVNPALMNKLGLLGKGLGPADMLHRTVWGSLLAYGTGNALGGGIIGTQGALIGGALGVRHAGKLSAIAGTYYGGKMVAKGLYNIAKSGHSHFQTQKMIHTDGDMSAFMTQGAFTSRERSIRAISRAQGNMRSALGREANYMHNAARSYFSPYRSY